MSKYILSNLEKYVIDAHHTLKTTKQKLDYVNTKIVLNLAQVMDIVTSI